MVIDKLTFSAFENNAILDISLANKNAIMKKATITIIIWGRTLRLLTKDSILVLNIESLVSNLKVAY